MKTKFTKFSIILQLFTIAALAGAPLILLADTPPPGTVGLKGATDGTHIGNVSDSLKVYVENPGGGTTVVNQGSQGVISSPWFTQVTNFPSAFGRTWNLLSTTDSVNVGNFPSNYSLESGGHLASLDAKTPALVGGSVPITGSITTSPAPPSDTVASGAMGTSGAVVSVSANGIADGAVNIVGSFVGSISIQCVPYGATPVTNLSTLQSGVWSSAAITTPGFYKWRGGNGCMNVQAAYSAYTSGTPTVYMAANQAVGNPTVSQPNAANLNATVVQSTGSNLHTVVDSGAVTATISGTPAVTVTSGTVTANQGGAPWSDNITQVGGVSVAASSVNGTNRIPVYLASGVQPNNTSPNWMDVIGGIDGSGKAQALSMTATQALKVDNSGVTQPISGSVTANLGTLNGAATAANQTTEIGYLSTIATNTGAQNTDITTTGTITALNGAVSISGQGVYTTSFSITGTWSATLVIEGQTPDSNWTALPINTISNALPYLQSMAITSNGTYAITAGGFTNIRIRASAFTSGTVAVAIDGSLAQQTVIANINTPDLTVTGASAQTATVNNILTATSGTAATFVGGLHSASVQVTSTGTGGTYIFEGSNDNVNFQTIPVYNQLILTGTPITAAITASASQIVYTFPIQTNYIRLRIATAITGGSIQSFSRFSQAAWSPTVVQIANATAANANVQATIASGTVTTVSTVSAVTSASLATNTTVTDLASVAKTATFTLAITPAAGAISEAFQMNVTAVSGTSPTMDCSILESFDAGVTYPVTLYQFERVTALLSTPLVTPLIRFNGNRLEYSCTIAGTTPSFTMALFRVGSQVGAQESHRAFDRTMAPGTASSFTSTFWSDGCTNAQFTYNQTAVTTNPTLTIQTSEDGVNFANTTYTIVPTGVGTFTTIVPNMVAKYSRLFVTSAGSGITYGYTAFKCNGP